MKYIQSIKYIGLHLFVTVFFFSKYCNDSSFLKFKKNTHTLKTDPYNQYVVYVVSTMAKKNLAESKTILNTQNNCIYYYF